jgi:hypothetical protein
MELGWFLNELHERTKLCAFPPLVTTATDGDNGGWFRNPRPEANFWGLYQAVMDQARVGGPVQPTFIDDYLDRYGAEGEVTVGAGAWNTGWHHGHGFVQWTGSQTQRDALTEVTALSAAVHEARKPSISWNRPSGGCCAPKPVAIFTGEKPGFRARSMKCRPPGIFLTRPMPG